MFLHDAIDFRLTKLQNRYFDIKEITIVFKNHVFDIIICIV